MAKPGLQPALEASEDFQSSSHTDPKQAFQSAKFTLAGQSHD